MDDYVVPKKPKPSEKVEPKSDIKIDSKPKPVIKKMDEKKS